MITEGCLKKMAGKYPERFRDDLMQEGRIAAWRAQESYKPGAGTSLATWQATCAWGAMRHFMRDKADMIHVPHCSGEAPPSMCDIAALAAEPFRPGVESEALRNVALEAAMKQMPAPVRDAFEKTTLQGNSLADAAKAAGVCDMTIWKRRDRAHSIARSAMGNTVG